MTLKRAGVSERGSEREGAGIGSPEWEKSTRKSLERRLKRMASQFKPGSPKRAAAIAGMRKRVVERQLLNRGYELIKRLRQDPAQAASLHNLAFEFQRNGNPKEARRLFERALATLEITAGVRHPETARTLSAQADLLQIQGDFAGALALFQSALSIYERDATDPHYEVEVLHSKIGALGAEIANFVVFADRLRRQGDLGEAIALYERALIFYEKQFGPQHTEVKALRAKLNAVSEANNSPVAEGSDFSRVTPRALPGPQGQGGYETRLSTSGQTEGFLLDAIPFPELNATQIASIVRHGEKRPWAGRREFGYAWKTDVFEFVRDEYGKWIPGLTQAHLKDADLDLYRFFTKQVSLQGLPAWLDVPSEPDAELRKITDPVEREKRKTWRELERNRSRQRRATLD